MKRFIVVVFMFLVSVSGISQKEELSNYSYVVVPDSFQFLNEPDKYQLNSMTLFYLDKSGFHAYSASNLPNSNHCDGLYADVEKLSNILGARVQVVLRDCKQNEIYRSEVGRSKIKDYERGFQDALRRAFKDLEMLGVQQKDLVVSKNSDTLHSNNTVIPTPKEVSKAKFEESNGSGRRLPSSKFSSYSHEGKPYLLRKSDEGYSLYEENPSSENGLRLVGKIIVMEKSVKFMDSSGTVSDVDFDASGNLVLKDATSSTTYKFAD